MTVLRRLASLVVLRCSFIVAKSETAGHEPRFDVEER